MDSSAFEISILLLFYLCIERYTWMSKITELPRFHDIKRYFKNSRNSLWIQILRRFPGIAPQYKIFHWITSFYNIFRGIALFYNFYHAIARLYNIYHDKCYINVLIYFNRFYTVFAINLTFKVTRDNSVNAI